MSIIKTKNLTKTYTSGDLETPVLHGISLSIETGEFVAIMGPSGSGKSTLMHILGFLDTPTSGSYFFDNQDASRLIDIELAHMRNQRVGFVFQAFHLLPRTTVLENVRLPLLYQSNPLHSVDGSLSNPLPHREGRGKGLNATHVVPLPTRERLGKGYNADAPAVNQAIQSVGLTHRANHLPNQLSGGEKQRVAIARAIVNNPDVIFADEPTGNLDSKSGTQILSILQSLNDAGHTIIMVTHEQDTARLAKRIIQMKDGKIVSDAPNAEWRDSNGELKK